MKSIAQALVALVSLLIAAALVVFCILFVWGSIAAVVLGCLALAPFVLVLMAVVWCADSIGSWRHERWLDRQIARNRPTLVKPEDKKGKRP